MKRKGINTRSLFKLAAVIIGLMAFNAIMGTPQTFGQVPGVTGDGIKIGIFGPFTGPVAVFSKTLHLSDSIFKGMVNETGGVHGRKIETILEDDTCDPVKGVAAVKKLIFQDKVFMLFGGMCGNLCLSVKKEIVQEKIPWISFGSPDALYEPVEKNIFAGFLTSRYVAEIMADFAMSKPGTKRVAVIKHSDEWGMAFHRPLIKYLQEKYNIAPVADVTIERGTTDATPQVLKIKEANPDFVFSITYVVDTSVVLRDAYKLGLDVPIIGTIAPMVDEQLNRVGIPEALKKFFTPHPCKYTVEKPEMDRWKQLLSKYYPKDVFDINTINGVGGPLAAVEALKKAGRDLTREKFIQGMESLDKFNPEISPLSVPLSYSPTNHVGLRRSAYSTIATGKVEIVYDWKDYEKLMKGK